MATFIHSVLGFAVSVCAGWYIGSYCASLPGWRGYAALGGVLALLVVWHVTGPK